MFYSTKLIQSYTKAIPNNIFYFQKKYARKLVERWYLLRIYICNMFLSVFSIFKLRHLKNPRYKTTFALTSTPTAPTMILKPASDDSFLRLDDSEIDFEDSPSNRSQNKSFGKLTESMVVNSTPLNHYSSHAGFRRNRSEISRTSLMYVEIDGKMS